jgi:hypothetical protein
MAITKEIEIKVNVDKATKSVESLNKEIKNTKTESQKSGEGIKDFASVADGATGGVIGKFGALTGTLGKVSLAFKSVGTAIIASGIGLLVVVIASIIAAFKSSEEGQNKFAKLMGVIGSVVGNVTDVLANIGELIISIFSGDSKAIKSATDFGKKIWDVVGLPIKNIIEIVKTAGKVLGSLFSGDVKGAIDNLKDGIAGVKQNFNEAGEAIDSAKNSLVEFGKEAIREAKIAQQIADQRAKADKTDRDLIVKRAEADRKIAQLREDAVKKDTFSLKERTEMLKQAQAIEENITNQEIESAKLRRDAKIEENKLSKSNKDALKEEEELKAKVIQLETSRLQSNRRITSSIQSLIAEENASRSAAFEAQKKRLEDERKVKEEIAKKEIEDEKKRVDEIAKINEDYRKKIEDLEDTTELQKLARAESRALLELERLNATEEEKLNLRTYYAQLNVDAQKKIDEKEAEDRKAFLLKQADEEAKNQDMELKAKEAFEDAKYSIANQTVSLIAGLAGKSKAIATTMLLIEKSLAISQVITNASRAIAQGQANLLAVPAFIGAAPNPAYIGQAIATAKGTAITKITAGLAIGNILAQTVGSLSKGANLGGDSSGGGGGGGQVPTAPSFNLVQGTGSNQIAESLQSQNRPIQAYVVASEVTTQQSLERNIISNSSL